MREAVRRRIYGLKRFTGEPSGNAHQRRVARRAKKRVDQLFKNIYPDVPLEELDSAVAKGAFLTRLLKGETK